MNPGQPTRPTRARSASSTKARIGQDTRVNAALEGMYRSKVYVEDTNTQPAAPGYSVFNWRARFEQKIEHWTFHQTLRLDNLLDRQYVGSVIVADGNDRFYEAAPGRSWYAGAGAQYSF